ncbi:catalase-related domain-containing protein [Deinococcus caeni]|uniref:catalase-related domain-containing protein n=1 Tax=Deinococcus caeni TaxID=569127 RepID=UPI00360C579A
MPLGSLADRFGWPEDDADLYGQPRELYRVMQPDERGRLAMNFAGALADVPAFIADRFIGHLEQVSGELAANVRAGIAQKKAGGTRNSRTCSPRRTPTRPAATRSPARASRSAPTTDTDSG